MEKQRKHLSELKAILVSILSSKPARSIQLELVLTKANHNKRWWGCWQKGALYSVGGHVNMLVGTQTGVAIMEISMEFLKKLKLDLYRQITPGYPQNSKSTPQSVLYVDVSYNTNHNN